MWLLLKSIAIAAGFFIVCAVCVALICVLIGLFTYTADKYPLTCLGVFAFIAFAFVVDTIYRTLKGV